MAVTTRRTPVGSTGAWDGSVGRPTRLEVATLAGGLAAAVLVGLDGSPPWQVARVVAVAALTSVVIVAERSASPRGRGWVAVAAGIPAVAVAVGFAPHVAKGGPVPVRLATIVLGVAALVLTVGGTAVATRGRGRPRRAGSVGVVVVMAAVVAFVAGPAVAATNVPRPGIGASPASVGLAFEDVSLRTSDGVSLAAWYVRSSNGGAVVLLHGAGSTRSDVLDHAAVLAGAGFGVLMVDARGHGESGGRAMDFGWHGDADIAAATDHLSARADVEDGRIGVVGMSMGGEEAVGATGSDATIRAVVVEGATQRVAGDEAWLSDEYGLRGFLQEQLERLQDRLTDPLTSASEPTTMRAAIAASTGTRYLFITAGDRPDEAHAAAYASAGAPDRVEIWTVDGAGHTAGLATARRAWATRVTDFLAGTLLADTADR